MTSKSEATSTSQTPTDVSDSSEARDREMGRDGEPKGDLGQKGKTWTPPKGEQGMSNRADDEGDTEK